MGTSLNLFKGRPLATSPMETFPNGDLLSPLQRGGAPMPISPGGPLQRRSLPGRPMPTSLETPPNGGPPFISPREGPWPPLQMRNLVCLLPRGSLQQEPSSASPDGTLWPLSGGHLQMGELLLPLHGDPLQRDSLQEGLVFTSPSRSSYMKDPLPPLQIGDPLQRHPFCISKGDTSKWEDPF